MTPGPLDLDAHTPRAWGGRTRIAPRGLATRAWRARFARSDSYASGQIGFELPSKAENK